MSAKSKLENFKPKTNHQSKSRKLSEITDAFFESTETYVNDNMLFGVKFNEIPNVIQENHINSEAAYKFVFTQYASAIKDIHWMKKSSKSHKTAVIREIIFLLYQDLLVYFNLDYQGVRLLFKNTSPTNVNRVHQSILKYKIPNSGPNPQIHLIVNSPVGLSTKSLDLHKPELDIKFNYNEDFLGIHKTILSRLSLENNKGLVLLHGKPGTGKTSYIRYLISLLNKDVIFLPPNMAISITNPDLISILIDNPNSVFVIEDAENIVIDRETNGTSPVTTLLNISDGLLSDCLNIQIICSFNTDISKIDSALMRKGRLIAKYEFKELNLNKTQALSKKLGFKTAPASPMTLAAIYNQSEKDFMSENKNLGIGFKIAS